MEGSGPMGDRLISYSLSDVQSAKRYQWTLHSDGLEMGFGPEGVYEEHAHLYLVDVIYSSIGVRLEGDAQWSQLIVVQPKVRFGPTLTGAFFFVKFIPQSRNFSIPDKVVGPDLEAFPTTPGPDRHTAPFTRRFSYFDAARQTCESLVFSAAEGTLFVTSTAGWRLQVLA